MKSSEPHESIHDTPAASGPVAGNAGAGNRAFGRYARVGTPRPLETTAEVPATPRLTRDPRADWVPSMGVNLDQLTAVQRKASGTAPPSPSATNVRETAARGVAAARSLLPHSDKIQAAFGHHDISGVRAQVGGPAAEACTDIGATAYATGASVAFASAPDLHTAAHEAAHVVQQRGGVQLKGGVGQAGDAYEQHADAVADRVVQGESAEHLLDQMAGGAGSASGAVQRKAKGSKRAAPKSAKGGKRLAVDNKPWDLGEQIVGSDHSFKRAAPWNTSTVQGQLTAKVVSKDKTFSLQGYPTQLYPTRTMDQSQMSYHLGNPLRVVFKPSRSGEFAAELVLTARFADGHSETASIVVKARARTLTQAPAENIEGDVSADPKAVGKMSAAEKKLYAEDAKRADSYPQNVEKEFDDVVTDTRDKAKILVDMQKLAVGVVEREAAKYQKSAPKVNRSPWWGLAEFALSVATAGVAGAVASKLGPRLAAALTKNKASVKEGGAFARLGPGLKAFLRKRQKGQHFKRIKASAIAKGVTDMVKEGIKGASKKGIGKARSLSKGDGAASQSSNAGIAFFSAQSKALIESELANKQVIGARVKYLLRPLLRVSPQLAIGGVEALESSYEDSRKEAEEEQYKATTTQWTRLIARTNLGSEQTRRATTNEPVTTTDLRNTRKLGAGIPAPKDGLLDIVLQSPHPPVKVVKARIHGVSQEIADRLGHVRLKDVPMPVRIVLGVNLARPTIITRDEAGRIRIAGDYAAVARHASLKVRPNERMTEAQAHQGATIIVDAVLSKSLVNHGIDHRAGSKEIETDDATGRQK